MSRVGKKPIEVPSGVKVAVSDRVVTVEGPKGTLTFEHRPEVAVEWVEAEKAVKVAPAESAGESRTARALWGTTRSVISNMVEGAAKGYEKKLEIVGVGWGAEVAGQNLKLVLGYANPVMVPIPEGVQVTVEKQLVTIQGADKQAVGQFAAVVRSKRPPEPYNGKGVRYSDEVIQKKQGKQFGA